MLQVFPLLLVKLHNFKLLSTVILKTISTNFESNTFLQIHISNYKKVPYVYTVRIKLSYQTKPKSNCLFNVARDCGAYWRLQLSTVFVFRFKKIFNGTV